MPEATTVSGYDVHTLYTCGMTGTRLIEDEDDSLHKWVSTYMTRAYPRGGRLKTRRN